jgi:hypothetical protein
MPRFAGRIHLLVHTLVLGNETRSAGLSTVNPEFV